MSRMVLIMLFMLMTACATTGVQQSSNLDESLTPVLSARAFPAYNYYPTRSELGAFHH